MALISSKGIYGLSAMYELSMHEQGKPMQTKEIAKKADIPQNYLEQLLILLKRAGLIKSIRGAHGGYILSKSVNDITIKEILIALEGSIKPFDMNIKNKVIEFFLDESKDKIEKIFDKPLSYLEDLNAIAYRQINYEI